jgi:hypothetical protein
MNFARVAINDTPIALTGNLLADTQPYTQTIANMAWRTFQQDLDEQGEPAATGEIVLQNIPPVASIDPSVLTYLNQGGYWDGASLWMPPTIAVLPQNFMRPTWIRERMGGSMSTFTRMEPCDDGLPGGPKSTFIRTWEFRSGFDSVGNQIAMSIWMPGATVARDLWIRFSSYLPDFQDNYPLPSTPWYQQNIPIYRSADALAFYIAATFAYSRGSQQASQIGDGLMAKGKEAMRKIMNRTNKIRQRINHRRRPYSAGKHQGWEIW